MANDTHLLKVSTEEAQTILNALAELPYNKVAPLLASLVNQLKGVVEDESEKPAPRRHARAKK